MVRQTFACMLILFTAVLMTPEAASYMNGRIIAYGDSTDTLVLDESFSGVKTIDAGISKIVLKNCKTTGGAKSGLMVPDGVTIELAEGTVNEVNAIESSGSMKIVGSGDLLMGSGLIADSGTLTLASTGKIKCDGGVIFNRDGDIKIESGKISCSKNNDEGGWIMSLGGKITINGGDITAHGAEFGITAEDRLFLNGGTIDASGTDYAIMGAAKTDSNEDGIVIGDKMKSDGYTVTKEKQKNGQTYYKLEKEDTKSTAKVTISDGTASSAAATSDESTKTAADDTEKEESGGGNYLPIILTAAGAAVLLLIAVIARQRRKNR